MNIWQRDIKKTINEVKTDNNITDIFVDLSQYYDFGRYNGELILNGGVSKGSLGVPCHVGCAKDTNAWIVLDDLVSQFLKRISRMLTPITYIVIVLGKIEILEAEDKCYTTFHYFIHHIKHS
jgi:tRNA G10  N-methylase Trm11